MTKMFTLTALAALLFGSATVASAHDHHDHHHHHEHHHKAVDYSAEFAAATPSTTIEVSACWVRNIPQPAPSAGYFVVKNNGDKAVSLLAAQSTRYDDLMLHKTIDEDGMAKMKMADKITIQPGSTLDFKPGGFHAMLEQPTSEVSTGEQVDLTLLFDNKETVTVECEVRSASGRTHAH